jgi:hypothetical protein
MTMLTARLLDSYLGQHISAICPNGYDADGDNHCAHFVSHVLQLDTGLTCAGMTRRPRGPGANLRVHELFERCPAAWEVRECSSRGEGLLFVSAVTSFRHAPGRMANVRKKHIGLVREGTVWHYSNTRRQVVSQPADMFLFHYPRQDNALWWGRFPEAASAIEYGISRAAEPADVLRRGVGDGAR